MTYRAGDDISTLRDPPAGEIKWRISKRGDTTYTYVYAQTAFNARKQGALDLQCDPLALEVEPCN
jgi:hypothetical protein